MGKKDAIVLVSNEIETHTSALSPAKTILPDHIDMTPANMQKSFLNKFIANQQVYTLLKDMKRSGNLLYTPKDIASVTHPLAKLIRMIFVEQRITDRYLEDMHSLFRLNQDFPQNEINSDRNNLRKALTKNEITYSFFEKVLGVFEAHVVDVIATIRLSNGDTYIYRKNKDFSNPPFPVITLEMIYNMDESGYSPNTSPIYPAESIYETTHPIAMLIHMYCVHQKISMEHFYFVFNEYYTHLGYTSNRVNAHRNNSVRQYFISSPTFKAWEKFNTVMGNTLKDFGVVIRHKDGTVVQYMVSDAKRIIDANAYLDDIHLGETEWSPP